MSDKQTHSIEELTAIRNATCEVVDALRLYATGVQGKPPLATLMSTPLLCGALRRLERLINPGRHPHGGFFRQLQIQESCWPADVAAAIEQILNATSDLLQLLHWQPICEGMGYGLSTEPAAEEVTTSLVGNTVVTTVPTSWRWPELPEDIAATLVDSAVRLSRRIPSGNGHDTPGSIGNTKLTPVQQGIISVLADAGHRMSTTAILQAFASKGKIVSDGTTKIYLAELVRNKHLTNRQDVIPPGYGLPEWDATSS